MSDVEGDVELMARTPTPSAPLAPTGAGAFQRAKHAPEFFQTEDRLKVDERRSRRFKDKMKSDTSKVQARLFKNAQGRTVGYYGGIEEEEEEQKKHFPFVTASFSIAQTVILIYSIILNGGSHSKAFVIV